jgi:nitrite reductase/ring-hydroxylating ferredoxin subunit
MTGTESTDNSDQTAPSDDLHHVASADQVSNGDRILADIEGREVSIFNIDGEFHAALNYCTHQGGPVCEGLVGGMLTADPSDTGWDLSYDSKNTYLSCPWHGWKFDIESGEHAGGRPHKIPTYEVEVHDGELYVRI